MKQTPREKQLISAPLDELVQAILRDDDYIEISSNLASAMFAVCRNNHTAFLQFPDGKEVNILDRAITRPILWRHHRFIESTERWLKNKRDAQAEREARFVFQFNVQQATKTIMAYTGVDTEFALPLAVREVKSGIDKKIIGMGGKPFIRNFKDLP